MGNRSRVNSMNHARNNAKPRRFSNVKGVVGYGSMHRCTLTHSTLCTRSGAAKSTPSVNGTGGGGEEGGGRGEQVRRGKNPRQGESLDKEKDKTDSTTTNKQDPKDTPAGRRIDVDVGNGTAILANSVKVVSNVITPPPPPC